MEYLRHFVFSSFQIALCYGRDIGGWYWAIHLFLQDDHDSSLQTKCTEKDIKVKKWQKTYKWMNEGMLNISASCMTNFQILVNWTYDTHHMLTLCQHPKYFSMWSAECERIHEANNMRISVLAHAFKCPKKPFIIRTALNLAQSEISVHVSLPRLFYSFIILFSWHPNTIWLAVCLAQ